MMIYIDISDWYIGNEYVSECATKMAAMLVWISLTVLLRPSLFQLVISLLIGAWKSWLRFHAFLDARSPPWRTTLTSGAHFASIMYMIYIFPRRKIPIIITVFIWNPRFMEWINNIGNQQNVWYRIANAGDNFYMPCLAELLSITVPISSHLPTLNFPVIFGTQKVFEEILSVLESCWVAF